MRGLFVVLSCGAIVFFALGLVGCGAMFNGSTQSVNVQASPTGTKVVTTPSTGEFIAPTTLSLERKHSYTLTFSRDGYSSKSVQINKKAQFGMIFLDVLFTGLVGVVVDATTGSWNKLSPDQVSVSLEKLESSSVDGPDVIEIRLSTGETKTEVEEIVIESSRPVGVSIESQR